MIIYTLHAQRITPQQAADLLKQSAGYRTLKEYNHQLIGREYTKIEYNVRWHRLDDTNQTVVYKCWPTLHILA